MLKIISQTHLYLLRFGELWDIVKKKNLLGNITNYWYRVECQNRGSLHIHMIVWLSDVDIENSDLITAELPSLPLDKTSENYKTIKSIHEYVLKYQIHHCQSPRF